MKLAGVILIVVVLGLAGCSKPTAESAYSSAVQTERNARIAADTLKSLEAVIAGFKNAADTYNKVITDFPGTAQAESSLFAVATIRNNDTKEIPLAIDGYKLYAEKYPSSPRAESALFLIGFLYNNEVHDTSLAGPAYRVFLQKYPTGDLATSARGELETLGKSPEELLKEKQAIVVAQEKPATKKSKH